MDYSSAPSWLQPPIPDLQNVVHDARTQPDDWKDQPPVAAQQTLDLADFSLGDIQVPSTSSSSSLSNPPAYFTFPQQYFLPNTPGPYNAVAYGTPQWSSNAPSQHAPPQPLPLSTYSTLNGATSSSSSSQAQSSSSQQQSQQQSGPLMIDPALTTINNPSASSSFQQYQHQHSPYLASLVSALAPQPRQQYSYQPQSHPPQLSINPTYVHSPSQQFQQTQSQRQVSQSQQQQQGTLSPYALHTPDSSLLSSLPPSSFYSPAPPPAPPAPTVDPEQRKQAFLSSIRPLLQPNSFTGAGAVSQLVGHIDDYGSQEVESQIRLEILTKIRDNAGNHYFRAWVENEEAMDITREWLKAGYTAKAESQLVDTIMPLLHIIDRLPLTIETLKASKLGRLIVRLVKEPASPAIKDMASNLERKWRQLLASGSDDSSKRMDVDSAEDPKGKKRKAEAPLKAPPTKKSTASVPPSKATTVKKETKSGTEVKNAKSDSSFFSAPKPKPKLPSFKKAPVPVKKEPDMNVAQPSSINPFEEALKSMRPKRDSPATSTPPPVAASATNTALSISSTVTKSGKVKKSVTWAAEGKLEMIKFIERAVYDDDPQDGTYPSHNVRDLDRDEGAALHAHLFEEQIEWTEPSLIDLSPAEARPKGEQSQEKATQEEREQNALVALYTTVAQIPDSPAEPPTLLPEDKVDENARVMLTGPGVDAIFWSSGQPAAIEEPQMQSSVAELVGQLAGDVPMADAGKAFGADPLLGLPNLSPEQLLQLMQHAQTLQQRGMIAVGQPAGAPQGAGDHNWNSQYAEPERGFAEDGGRERRAGFYEGDGWSERGGGRGGRGRGRGRGRGDGFRNNKRKPCSFFAAGRCRYGDQCDFSHDPIY